MVKEIKIVFNENLSIIDNVKDALNKFSNGHLKKDSLIVVSIGEALYKKYNPCFDTTWEFNNSDGSAKPSYALKCVIDPDIGRIHFICKLGVGEDYAPKIQIIENPADIIQYKIVDGELVKYHNGEGALVDE